MSSLLSMSDGLCLPEIPFSGFHQSNIVTLRSKLAPISIRQGQVRHSAASEGHYLLNS